MPAPAISPSVPPGDVDAMRCHFPHTEDRIYLNHAATSPLSRAATDAIQHHLQQRQGATRTAQIDDFESLLAVIKATRTQVAELLQVDTERVDFAPNTSAALNLLADGLDWQPGNRIAVPDCEFPTNVFPFKKLEAQGVALDFIPTERGTFSVDDVARTLTPDTRLVSVSWIQFLSGFRADLEAIGALCHERDILFCVDAIQGLGAFSLDVEATHIDFLAAGTHKWLMGTQGLAVFYVREVLQNQLTPPTGWLHGPVNWTELDAYELTLHDDARRFRTGTMNALGILALHAALTLRDAFGGAHAAERTQHLAHRLADGCRDLGLDAYLPHPPESGIVTLDVDDAESVCESLADERIIGACRNDKLRLSPAYYVTDTEIDRTLAALERICAPTHA